MKRILLATLVLGLAGSAKAQPLELNGSDTLFDFTQALLPVCGVDPLKLVYRGGGSGLGEDNMATSPEKQQIAPMSRFFGAGKFIAGVSTGCKVALDGLAILTDDDEGNDCDTGVYTGFLEVTDTNGVAGLQCGTGGCVDGPDADTDADDYEFTDWRDVLRIVYGGQTEHKPVADACQEAPTGRSALANKDCNSDVRRALVNNWEKLFQESTGCNSTDPDACSQLRHAFRRDDFSGTTDVFGETIGLPKLATTVAAGTSKPFCNGAEQEDEDPIRRDCADTSTGGSADGDEQVCNSVSLDRLGPTNNASNNLTSFVGWRGGPISNPPANNIADLGLVLSVIIPQVGAYQDTNPCSFGASGGAFRLAPMPAGAGLLEQQKCPDGRKRSGGQCAWPAINNGTSFVFGCINKKRNVPGARTIANMDGRVYNLIARNAGGSIQTVERIASNGASPPVLTQVAVPVHHAIYRIHQSAVMPGGTFTPASPVPTPWLVGTVGCQFPDATDQIGCLMHASPCSIGFSGLGATERGAKALALQVPNASGPVLPTPATIRRVNDPFGASCGTAGDYDERYPLSRNLYYNSRKGFEGADGIAFNFDNIGNTFDEQKLIKCACDRHYSDVAAEDTGFIPLTDTLTDGVDNDGDGNTDEAAESCSVIGAEVCRTPVRTAL